MVQKPTYEELRKRVLELEQVELECKRAEEELAQIFSMSLDMICIADINTATFRKVNPAFMEILGFSEQELLEKSFLDFIHPDDVDATVAVISQRLQSGTKVINFENRYRCKDGSYRWLSWVSHPDPEKGVTFAIARDITDWKKTEDDLKKSKAILDATGRMAKVGGWELNAKTMEVTWTEETYRIHEVPFDQQPPLEKALDYFHPEDKPKLAKAIQQALDFGEPYDMEVRFITAKGKHLWTRTICRPEIVNGKVVKLLGTFQDITDRKQVEEKLAFVEKRNQSLLDHSPVCHKIVDHEFNLQYMSKSGYKMLKLEETDNIYGRPYPFPFFPEAARNALTEKLHEVKKSGQVIGFESMACDSERNDVWLHHSIIPVQEDDSGIGYITIVSADITEQKRLQQRMRQSEKMESVGRLAGGVAHDFNNMLSVIIGHVEMAMENLAEDSPLYESLEEIKNAADRSANLTGQLLAFARKQVISPRKLDLNKAVEGTLKILRRLIGEHINLTFIPGKKIWPVMIDPGQIDQILTNLCVNARDSITDVGKISIETNTVVLDEFYCSNNPGFIPGEYALLAVSDNGSGMDSETLSNIFEPFFTTKGIGKGTGLGLSTVYGVVKQNQGFVNVYSEPGQGSTFRIYLPRYRKKGETHVNEAKDVEIIKGQETILLVEDEPAILNMTAKMLKRLGYQVFAASTPGRAIRLAQEYGGDIHLLITDVVMPEMNGRDLAKNILSLHPNMKRLFMSGYTANVIAHHGILDEGVNFIQKPFSREQLGVKLREVLAG